jgi:MFS family permease
VLIVPGLLVVGYAGSVGVTYVGLFLMALGSGLVMPCLSALVSHYSPPERQGVSLGTFRAFGALSRAIGPVVGGILYWRLGSQAPYTIGAITLVVPVLMALGLPPVPSSGGEPGT